jgi:hypothetical protein
MPRPTHAMPIRRRPCAGPTTRLPSAHASLHEPLRLTPKFPRRATSSTSQVTKATASAMEMPGWPPVTASARAPDLHQGRTGPPALARKTTPPSDSRAGDGWRAANSGSARKVGRRQHHAAARRPRLHPSSTRPRRLDSSSVGLSARSPRRSLLSVDAVPQGWRLTSWSRGSACHHRARRGTARRSGRAGDTTRPNAA